MMILAAVLHIVAIANADKTLLSCNSCVGIIANVLISTRYLGEKFDPKNDTVGLTLISIGSIVTVLLSNKEKQVLDLKQLVVLLTSAKSLAYFGTTVVVLNLGKLATPLLLTKVRAFEKDCEKWEKTNKSSILPKLEGGLRSERVLIQVLNEMDVNDVAEVSPQSSHLKMYVKLPMLLFVLGASLLTQVSDIIFKLISETVKEAQADSTCYFYLIPLIGGVIFSATQTLLNVNEAMKYYDQMMVMPIYQTAIMIWSILVGMLCLNEIRFYAT